MKHVRIVFLFFCLILVSGAWADTGMFKANPERNGDYSAVMGTEFSNGKLLWSTNVGANWLGADDPVISNGVIYISGIDDKMIYALGAKNKTVLWTYYLDELISSHLTAADGKVFFGTLDGNVYALDARTGSKVWEAATDPITYGQTTKARSIEASPLVSGSYVYAMTSYGIIYKFDKDSGARAAKIDTGNTFVVSDGEITEIYHSYTFSSPAISNDVLYTGCTNIIQMHWTLAGYGPMMYEYVCAYTPSGSLLWKAYNGNTWHFSTFAVPAVDGDRVYTSGFDGNLSAYDTASGTRLWRFNAGTYWSLSPTVANGTVYTGAYPTTVYALDAATGVPVWSYDMHAYVDSWVTPAYANDVVYVTGNYYDSIHETHWSNLVALNAATGEKLWNYSTETLLGSPVLYDGVVYVRSQDGWLYALGNASYDRMPVPDFSADVTTGIAPLAVNFTDLSNSKETLSRRWQFTETDGYDVTGPVPANPSFTYNIPGYYYVSLSVTNASGTNTTARAAYIHVLDEPFSFDGPYITKINITPKTPTTLHNAGFTAEIAEDPDYEIIGYDWQVSDTATGATDWLKSGNSRQVTYRPAAGRYKNKVVRCTMTYREKATGQLGFSYASEPFKIYFELGNVTAWTDDDHDGLPNWYEYWKKDATITGIENFQYTTTPEAGEYDPNTDQLYVGPEAPTTWMAFTLNTPLGPKDFGGLVGINNTGATVLHESNHKWIAHQWKPGGQFVGLADSDRGLNKADENDSLPDTYEDTVSLTSNNSTDTYNLSKVLASGYRTYGDEEYMCYRAELNYSKAVIAARDWANPGLQSGPGGVVNIAAMEGMAGSSQSIESSKITRVLLGNTNGAGDTDTARDTNGNTLYDYLTIATTVNSPQDGLYTITGTLTDTSGDVVTETRTQTLSLNEGNQTVSLDFSGKEIFGHGVNGPYKVGLTFWAVSRESFVMEDRPDFLVTDLYSFTEFEGAQAYLSGSYSDEGTDTNADGTFEYLTVSRDLTVTRAGNYRLEGYLETGDNESGVVFAQTVPATSPGTSRISLQFDGNAIGQSHKNGPYNVTALALYDNDEEIQFIPFAATTSAYNFRNFIAAPVTLKGTFRDSLVDTNADGLYEYLVVEADVTADTAGTYIITGVLSDQDGGTVATAANMTTLGIGDQTASLYFAGGDIYRHGVSGPYTLENARISGTDFLESDQIYNGHTTAVYDYLSFARPPVLEARFSAFPTIGALPLVVDFTDKSPGSPKTWNWSFGDGNVSADKKPVHVYSADGLYTVNLTVSNGYETNSTVMTDYINVTTHQEPLIAWFAADKIRGPVPLTVHFTDLSEGNPSTWYWHFDDYDIAAEQNPVYTFATEGNHTVYLEVMRSMGYNVSSVMTIQVLPPQPLIVSFTANKTSGTVPLSVQFSDTTTGSPTAWNWSFGDGDLSTSENPTHTYQTPGTYTVSLHVTNGNSYNYTSRTGAVVAKAAAKPAIISTNPTAALINQTINFTIMGTGFDTDTGNTGVNFTTGTGANTFSNCNITLESVTPTRITGRMKIDPDVSTGKWDLVVTTKYGGPSAVKAGAILVTKVPTPTITAFTPAWGTKNTTVEFTLTGTNFQAGEGKTGVRIHEDVMDTELAVNITSLTLTRITGTVNVTNDAMAGSYILEVRTVDGGTATKPAAFAVRYAGIPTIATFKPDSGYRNETVTFSITGTNFEPHNTVVAFKNQTTGATLNTTHHSVVTGTAITGTIHVPANAPTGYYRLDLTTMDGGVTNRRNAFRVKQVLPPAISSITPTTGAKGSVVAFTIRGANFQSTEKTTVQIYDVVSGTWLSTTLYQVTDNTIIGSITIPNSAPSGKYTIEVRTADGGTASKYEAFTVNYLGLPLIGSITPITGKRGTNVNFTLKGSNFVDGGTIVRLRIPGSTINSTVLTANSSVVLGYFPIPAGATTGSYRLDVFTQGGGIDNRLNGFSVT
ncbi:MAG TPA: PQQ-binding-like beta-propeller repeat protein [Methanoregula sp.]|nr:PQQ-binding-like beta-propeller repeat protein [Methanoregula sp.]